MTHFLGIDIFTFHLGGHNDVVFMFYGFIISLVIEYIDHYRSKAPVSFRRKFMLAVHIPIVHRYGYFSQTVFQIIKRLHVFAAQAKEIASRSRFGNPWPT